MCSPFIHHIRCPTFIASLDIKVNLISQTLHLSETPGTPAAVETMTLAGVHATLASKMGFWEAASNHQDAGPATCCRTCIEDSTS